MGKQNGDYMEAWPEFVISFGMAPKQILSTAITQNLVIEEWFIFVSAQTPVMRSMSSFGQQLVTTSPCYPFALPKQIRA